MYKLTRYLFFFFFFLFNATVGHTQTIAQIDSLLKLKTTGNDVIADKLLYDHIYQKSKAIGYKKGMAKALVRNGVLLVNQNKYGEALKLIEQGEILAREINDNAIITRALISKSRCFAELGFSEQGNSLLNEAKEYVKKIEDPEQLHFNLGGIYRSYALNLKLRNNVDKLSDSILKYLKLGYEEQSKIKNPLFNNGLILVLADLGQFYIEKKNYDSARLYLNKAIALLGENKSNPMALPTYFELGFLSYEAKKYDAALVNYNQALEIASNMNATIYKRDTYLALSNIYDEMGDRGKAKEFLKKYIKASELIQNEKGNSLIVPMAFIIKENERIHVQREQSYVRTIIVFAFSLLLVLVVGFFLYRKFHKEKISAKEKAYLFSEKIKQLEAQVPKQNLDSDDLKAVVQLAIANDPSFFVKFNEFDSGFVEKLLQIAPNLVASELELCAQLRLCFETKEIARYTGLSVRAIQGKKHRIRKKLNIPMHEDLNIWMSRL